MTLRTDTADVAAYDPPPPRDRLPTLPHDLSEYAWVHTGPDSVPPPLRPEPLEPLDVVETGVLVDLWHSDVPRVTSETMVCADHREAFVVSLLDGESTVGSVLAIAGLPDAEVLAILCELCARGVVSLDRSRRIETPIPVPLASVA